MKLTQKLYAFSFALITCALMLAAGCSTAPKTATETAELELASRATLARVETKLPAPKTQYVGFAVFPDISEGAVGIGGAYGKGTVIEGGKIVGYTDMKQASLGWQLGGKTFKEVIVFRDADSLARFKSGKFEFDAKANVIASDSAAGVAAQTVGTSVYLIDKEGLMFSASVSGQKFTFVAKN
jgi:lipid-binding SYLF domain-containing protein